MSELKPEFLGIAAINSFIANTSSPRGIMLNAHFNSHLPLLHPESRLIKSGAEYELDKFINDCRIDEDCIVKAIIPRYGGNTGVKQVPEHLLIVEFEKNGQLYLDCIEVQTYKSHHTHFGYPLEPTDEFKSLHFNKELKKGTILSQARSHMKNGDYAYGVNANVALMSHPSVSEDGYVISRSFCDKLTSTSYLRRTIYLDKNLIPLNLYGDNERYKAIPDIGEKVMPNGALCALRKRNNWFTITDFSNNGLADIDPNFDTMMYVNPHSEVVDIKVIKNNFYKTDYNSDMNSQLDFYANLLIMYYKNFLSAYEQIRGEKKKLYNAENFVKLTPRMHAMLMEAYTITQSTQINKIKLCYRKVNIDHYKIDIVTRSDIRLNIGHKIVDTHAAKGVTVLILPDEAMPVDKNGVRADVISDPSSVNSRMNFGRVYEGYLGAVSRDNRAKLIQFVRDRYGVDFKDIKGRMNGDDITYIQNFLAGLYALINPQMLEFINSLNPDELYNHIGEVLNEAMYIYYPVDNEYNITDVITNIDQSIYAPLNGPVQYQLEDGTTVESEENIRIVNMYYLYLEKIAHTYNGVSSAKINTFGFPIKGSTIEKYKSPHALTPTKTLGETEIRILTSYLGEKAVAELLDLNLNPISHKLVVKRILTDMYPSVPTKNIERAIYPYGQNKSLLLLKHIFNACGIDIGYQTDELEMDPAWETFEKEVQSAGGLRKIKVISEPFNQPKGEST